MKSLNMNRILRNSALVLVTSLTLITSARSAELTDADKKMLIENRLLLMLNGSTAEYVSAKIGASSESFGTDLEKNHILMLQNQLRFRAISEKMGIPTAMSEASKLPTLVEQNNALLLENRAIIGKILGKLEITPPPAPSKDGSLVSQNNGLLKANRMAMEKIAAAVDAK